MPSIATSTRARDGAAKRAAWSLVFGVSILTTGMVAPALAVPGASATAALTEIDVTDTAMVPVQAPADQKPRINVGKVILVEPAGETAMPIQVGPIDAIPRNSFVRIRGMPVAAALSEGHSIAPGSWAIPLAVLPNLRLTLPAGITGKSNINIALVQIDGTVLAEAQASLVIAAAALIAPDRPTPPPRERSVASVGPAPSPLEASPPPAGRTPVPETAQSEPPPMTAEQKQAQAFVVRGRALIEAGNVAAARLFFQRAVDAGLPEGALALASTYDPSELTRMRVAGVQPDVRLARQWYEKARELGAKEADERLRRLGAR